ncbi:MAG: HEAT repeat domain-containing protein [Candidatus Rokubacteria bacterium]|nr:HEAT repeat domain-containing protein [Candidatus Rokubacteria bacterium]
MTTSQVPLVVEGFFRELLGAKKAVRLYPPGNPLATDRLQRLHRSFQGAVKEGLPAVLRVGSGRFEWDGGQLLTRDPTLEAFRFELETRRITEIGIQPGVASWEFRELLESLNLTHDDVEAAGGFQVLLDRRNVTNIVVRGMLWGARDSSGTAGVGPAMARRQQLESLVNAILDALGEEFRDLTYDRVRLSGWFLEVAEPGDRADALFTAIQMLIPMVETEADREIRYRTINECLMALPEPLRISVFSAWLMPAVRTDLQIVNLISRFSGDDFAELTGLIQAHALEALRADIEALPSEEWKKARISESLEDALAEKEVAAAALEPLITDDDPGLLSFREAARAGCAPGRALAHSVNVFFYLIGETESERYPALFVDVLEDMISEALMRDRLPLALRILRLLGQGDQFRPEWLPEHQRRLQLLHRRLAGRSQVTPLADLLRRSENPGDAGDAAEYLRILGRAAIDEFITILGDEEDGRVRGRMLDVLGALGPDAAPALSARVGDSHWSLARSMIALLTRIGDPAALEAVQRVAKHEHPQVRREVARALATLGGKRALKPLLDYLSDPDDDVRLTAIKLLGTLVDAATVASLREFLVTPTRTAADLLVKRDMITALASIGTPEARVVLESIAQRRVWPWRRNELTIRDLASGAVKSMEAPAAAVREV